MGSFAYLYERFPSFVQTFVYREALEMVRQGMEPRLISIRRPDDPADLGGNLIEDGPGAGILYLPERSDVRGEIGLLREGHKLPKRVHRAIPEARKQKDSTRLFEAIWIAPHLQRDGIRHVHAHFGGMAARTAWWLQRLYGISYSFTGHANDIFCENPFPVSNGDLVRDAKFVVTETDFARDWMVGKYPSAKGKIVRVYNGIDRDFPGSGSSGGSGNSDATDGPEGVGTVARILSVGRSVEKKGFTDLIEACRLLRARGVSFLCEIVGGGPLDEVLQAQINAASLGESVRLRGPLPQTEVRQLLAGAHLFVLACVPEADGGSDNLPTVIMEAMMCGVPVVSTLLAGVPEMIQHGETGLLVEPRNPAALSAAIEGLLGDRVRAESFADRGREAAIRNFSIENTTRALKHLLVRRAGVEPPPAALALDPELPHGWFGRWFGR